MIIHPSYSPEQAREALQFVDPGTDRATWVKTLAAAKAAGLDFDDIHAWSSSAPNYVGERDVQTAWRSIDAGGPIQAGTLFHQARAAGWKPQNGEAFRPVRPAPSPRPEPKRQRASTTAEEVWSAAALATSAHPYIERKRGRADGLRICAGNLRIAGHDMVGALLVPVTTLSGELVSLQCIPADGPKLNLPGHKMAGVFVVGEIEPNGRAYVVEGIGQAWACWQATGHAAVVAFGWGRVRTVVQELKAAHPSVTLTIVPDTGKEADAEAIARDMYASVAAMPTGSPRNFDANDYAQEQGHDALAALLDAAETPAGRFKLLGADDLAALPPLQWRVRSVLPRHGLGSIYGPSTSGKSFLAIDLAARIALGDEWFGYAAEVAPVAYLALEGEHGIAQRVRAWRSRHGDLPDNLRFITQPFSLLEDVSELAAELTRSGMAGGVCIIDTLNRAAPLMDENSAQDMGRIIDAAKALQLAIGGLVLLVHHTGKDATKGLRGHSSLYAALDVAIEVSRSESFRSWKLSKSKDGRDGDTHQFTLSVVELGVDEEGEPLTSCVVAQPDWADAAEPSAPRLPKGGNQRIVYDNLGPLLRASNQFGKAGAPHTRPCISLEDAIAGTKDRLAVEPKRRSERARQAITGLIASGIVGANEGWIWLI